MNPVLRTAKYGLYHKEDAIEIAKQLQASSDDWVYEIEEFVGGLFRIIILDEEDEFVAYWQ
jgi:hypothetical protein